MGNVLITVTRSAGADEALVVFVDNHGDLPVRVVLNDGDDHLGVEYQYEPGREREAKTVSLTVGYDEVAYEDPAGVSG